jgi:hypothetical protein
MRFYQNEIVNLSVQFIAVSSAYRCASESGRDAVLKQLVSFDRNRNTRPNLAGGVNLQQLAPLLEQIAKMVSVTSHGD